ncbi:hypothetical protein OHB19_39265 [Streptomyces sp. NBC_00893]|nr:hypothetical protein [Streptomyces sp. NBC_00893]
MVPDITAADEDTVTAVSRRRHRSWGPARPSRC